MHGKDNDWFKTGIELREGYCTDFFFPILFLFPLCKVHSLLFLIWIFSTTWNIPLTFPKLVSQGLANREILS